MGWATNTAVQVDGVTVEYNVNNQLALKGYSTITPVRELVDDNTQVTTSSTSMVDCKTLAITPTSKKGMRITCWGKATSGTPYTYTRLQLKSGADVSNSTEDQNITNNSANPWSHVIEIVPKNAATQTIVNITHKRGGDAIGGTPAQGSQELTLTNSKTWTQQDTLLLQFRASSGTVAIDGWKVEEI